MHGNLSPAGSALLGRVASLLRQTMSLTPKATCLEGGQMSNRSRPTDCRESFNETSNLRRVARFAEQCSKQIGKICCSLRIFRCSDQQILQLTDSQSVNHHTVAEIHFIPKDIPIKAKFLLKRGYGGQFPFEHSSGDHQASSSDVRRVTNPVEAALIYPQWRTNSADSARKQEPSTEATRRPFFCHAEVVAGSCA
jgi:hypothetical protein